MTEQLCKLTKVLLNWTLFDQADFKGCKLYFHKLFRKIKIVCYVTEAKQQTSHYYMIPFK